ncbi:hypothetical protein SISNIDRAFT_454891 [Sistotremastrum niveocremeum HHB9708]|uniref:SMP-LTD domain-containing protein n=1 Tax=Sistotremastrum niveocremeum HHB9708 TaxID=1314777 RepID=A0A164U5S3_9AGAM|nr:hypothetical protein SISNIDRAFT_454891 [Sistotremastrum niveocremeum HHB9708]
MANHIFTLQPTFTQGLILGQLSVILLLAVVLKYLFLNSEPRVVGDHASIHPGTGKPARSGKSSTQDPNASVSSGDHLSLSEPETLQWFNEILRQVFHNYRREIRGSLDGDEGDEFVRRKIELAINELRPAKFMDFIKVHSVDIGASAPSFSKVSIVRNTPSSLPPTNTVFHITYTDSISISISTSILLHYPSANFARLPVALSVSLALFSSELHLQPPSPDSLTPEFTVSLAPDFDLELQINSLMGSRAKLADVPKVHEMIQTQVRRLLLQKGIFKIVLPSLTRDKVPTSSQQDQI